ncbi:response regulator [Spirosoma rhododendri]|uniref:Response regulator n=1 Tax=Spirosoma rhododendri TaxID=2728024 RepID=A0A7L5DNW4_9BACT|nr:response regulator [Spirosoma rhododendri]QJD78168.1 response regulator [Spirosoma rhododendri]
MNVTMAPVSSKKRRRSTILVVEDNADQWLVIKWALERQFSEVNPVWVANADDALLYLDSCEDNIQKLPRLVLLDLYLPTRETGWHLLQLIKTHYLYREIPVITLSASMDQEDITESYMLRSNSYIIKPGSLDKWAECISAFRHYWWDAVTLPKTA